MTWPSLWMVKLTLATCYIATGWSLVQPEGGQIGFVPSPLDSDNSLWRAYNETSFVAPLRPVLTVENRRPDEYLVSSETRTRPERRFFGFGMMFAPRPKLSANERKNRVSVVDHHRMQNQIDREIRYSPERALENDIRRMLHTDDRSSSNYRSSPSSTHARCMLGKCVNILTCWFNGGLTDMGLESACGGMSRCGGSLVNRRWVVTAGHCVARASRMTVRITLGEYMLGSRAEPLPGRVFKASRIVVHPYFKFSPQADRYDVAAIRLNRPVRMAPHIRPICLPPKNLPLEGMMGTASGWGALRAKSSVRPRQLQAVDVPVIGTGQCERWHKRKNINVVIYDEMVCAGYNQGGRDSCQGDSGGPLMHQIDGRWTLIGIVSAGFSCAKQGQPGIYHRVPKTSDWLSHVVNS